MAGSLARGKGTTSDRVCASLGHSDTDTGTHLIISRRCLRNADVSVPRDPGVTHGGLCCFHAAPRSGYYEHMCCSNVLLGFP